MQFFYNELSKKETPILKEEIKESLALLYNENSKLDLYSAQRLAGQITDFLNNAYFIEKSNLPFKCYHEKEKIDLSLYEKIAEQSTAKNILEVLQKRRSTRTFDKNYKLSLYELFFLLHYAYGVTKREPIKGHPFEAYIHHRNVPSGGGLYPLELYVLLLKADIPSGLYHFRPDICVLEKLKEEIPVDFVQNNTGVSTYIPIEEISALIFTSAVFARTLAKYSDRGYRFILHESGGVAMTMSMLCENLNLGSCILGGFLDDPINDFLEIDGYNESIINVMAIGGKK